MSNYNSTSSTSWMEVGLPINPNTDPDDAQLARQSFLMLKLQPKEPRLGINTNTILELVTPDPSHFPPNKMKIYFQPITIQDSFSNALTNSFLSNIAKISTFLQQGSQLMGITGQQINDVANSISQTMGLTSKNGLKKIATTLVEMFAGYRIDYPKVWEDSAMEVSKEVRIYLRANPENEEDYDNNIVQPIQNLLMYVLPKSVESPNTTTQHRDYTNMYRWPFFCSVEAPGLFSLPEAMLTNMIIDKGLGTVFGYNNRPSEIEITLQFTPLRNVIVNDIGYPSYLPFKLTNYIKNLKDKKSYSKTQNIIESNNQSLQTKSGLVTLSNLDKQAYNSLKS